LYRFVLPAILLMAHGAQAAPAERGQLDANPTLFTVMAALNATGFDADVNSPNNHPLRDAIRAELAKRDIPSLPELKRFFEIHRRKTAADELSQYISFALNAADPPNFEIKARELDLPPDVTPLLPLSGLLARFYKEGGIEDLWNRSQAAIDQYAERYHAPVSKAVLEVNSYLRHQTSGFQGRRFQVYIELLAPPNHIQTRSYNEYTIVVTPSAEPQIAEVRHAYLHYMLDPLATRHQEILMRKRGLGDHAQRAATLAESYKSDFLLLATESLIKVIESRLDRKPETAVEALKQGYILAPYFAEALPIYEKQEQGMLVYFPDLVMPIDLRREEARLAQVEFQSAAVQQAKPAPLPPPPLAGAEKTLDEAEQLYTARDLEPAKQQYLRVLQETDDKPMHARAYYGLARIAALQKDPEVAERLFQKTIESAPDPQVKAWALVYLGRLADAAGEREQAVNHFRSALEVEGASAAARQAAEQGVRQTTQKQ
jgi:tetratricopeptide (TPR) repeat protein